MQPRGQADPGVLRHGEVGDLGVALEPVEPLRLLLEVVEHGEHRLFPAHDLVRAPARASRKRSVDKRLTPDDSERCLMQTQANARIWAMHFDDLLVSGSHLGPRLGTLPGRGSWSSRPPSEVVSDGPRRPHRPARLPGVGPPGAAGRPRRGAGRRRRTRRRTGSLPPRRRWSRAGRVRASALPVPDPTDRHGARRTARSGSRCDPGDSLWRLSQQRVPAGLGTRTSLASSSAPTAPTAE